jgi:tetratricopeptide (TPR) repeat protein
MSTQEQYRLGITAYVAGEFDEAIRLLTPVAAGRRNGVDLSARYYLSLAHHRLAVRLFEARCFPEATKHFQAAAKANPEGGDYARFLAACHLQTGRLEPAARQLQAVLDRRPDDAKVRIQLALVTWRQGGPTEAQAILREGLRYQPVHAELHYQLGVMLAAEDNFAEAEQLFERTIALDPTHPGAYEHLAQCCALLSRFERALSYLQRAHQLDPSNSRIALQLNLLAQSLMADGGNVKVQWCPPKASRQDPASIERLGEAILREPDFVEAFLSLPETAVDGEVFSTLAAVLEQALQSRPEYADLHYHCGAVYRRLGRHDDALRHAERAVELNARYVNALVLLADLYARTDRWGAGVERLEQAIRAGADYPDVHYLLGRLFQSGGQLDRARQAYQRALDLNGEYEAAKEALTALAA